MDFRYIMNKKLIYVLSFHIKEAILKTKKYGSISIINLPKIHSSLYFTFFSYKRFIIKYLDNKLTFFNFVPV